MSFLLIIQCLLALGLITTILLQSSSGGLGSSFGGSTSYHTKRGMEKGLFAFTVVLAILFTLVSIIALVVS